jgi:hypothetical protein
MASPRSARREAPRAFEIPVRVRESHAQSERRVALRPDSRRESVGDQPEKPETIAEIRQDAAERSTIRGPGRLELTPNPSECPLLKAPYLLELRAIV